MREPKHKSLEKVRRHLAKQKATRPQEIAIRAAIRQIEKGKVATYGQVAAAAGYPLHHRQVVQILRRAGDLLPWQRVVGADGTIRLPGEAGLEQRRRLCLEGVQFRGKRVNLKHHQFTFRPWEIERAELPLISGDIPEICKSD